MGNGEEVKRNWCSMFAEVGRFFGFGFMEVDSVCHPHVIGFFVLVQCDWGFDCSRTKTTFMVQVILWAYFWFCEEESEEGKWFSADFYNLKYCALQKLCRILLYLNWSETSTAASWDSVHVKIAGTSEEKKIQLWIRNTFHLHLWRSLHFFSSWTSLCSSSFL